MGGGGALMSQVLVRACKATSPTPLQLQKAPAGAGQPPSDDDDDEQRRTRMANVFGAL